MQLGVKHCLQVECPAAALPSIGHQAKFKGQSILPLLPVARINLTVAIGLRARLPSK